MKNRLRKAMAFLILLVSVALWLTDAELIVNYWIQLCRGLMISGPVMVPLFYFSVSLLCAVGFYLGLPIARRELNIIKGA